MNSMSGKYKFSKLEVLVNLCMGVVFALQIVLALIAAGLGSNFIN